MEELNVTFSRSRVFMKLDLCQGDLQVALHPASRNLTAFVTHMVIFRYTRMPFGLSSAPSCFQKIVSTILAGFRGVVVYLDNIVVHGCLPIPLFNQKKRSRVPLTSTPLENEFFSHSEYMAGTSSAAPHGAPGIYGCYPAIGRSSGAPQSLQWNRQGVPPSTSVQQYGSNRAAISAARTYSPMPHPYKSDGRSSVIQLSSVRQQDASSGGDFRQNNFKTPRANDGAQSKPTPNAGFSRMGQQSSCRPPSSTNLNSQLPRPPPPAVPSPRRPLVDQKMTPPKPTVENSLRILTAVIDGMRHWSQFKDKVPSLFELFATLDSAVTIGHYGAKNFLMRDGKDVVQCVFYENEQVLPRLIRGQVHRCLGNYDRSRDVLMCVSVRTGLSSEMRNAQEAVKACDAEMRALVKSLSEI
ncbi:spermatogenesis-associated protein 22 [Pholidichthys leucotaenia]